MRSSGGEHFLDAEGVSGSNPLAPTIFSINKAKMNRVLRALKSGFSTMDPDGRAFLLYFRPPHACLHAGGKRSKPDNGPVRENIGMQPIQAVYPDGQIKAISSSEEALGVLRHSTSHLMAAAVLELFPGTHLGIGPATEDGFYYDFETAVPFGQDDLEKIEERMREISKRETEIQPLLWDKQKAIEHFQQKGEHLKVELIQERAGEVLSCYQLGEMIDFCRGYAYIVFVKNLLGEERADAHIGIKKIIDKQVASTCQ